ncbi:MAG: methyltransferase domain-containing protein [Candidatus Omnitrophota bacterium]
MLINKCRVCGGAIFKKPLLRYVKMPRSAQYLPDARSLKKDRGISLDVCQCEACGLVQLKNPPVPYYREVIRAVGVSREMRAFRKKQFAEFVKKYSLKNKKVVEIGCGRGDYLALMRQAGTDAYGLEYSLESVRHCLKNGLKASRGFIRTGGSAGPIQAPFDAFFMLSFLEHLPDPNAALRGIHKHLREGGSGLVEVPNFDMILRDKLFSEFIPDHLLYFTGQTLRTALELNGFAVIEMNEVWHDYIISAVVRKRPRTDLSGFRQQQAMIKGEIERYIRRFKEKRVAVWGAGHQALALLSLANLSGKIKYVVDSAGFKQGKFTPATHIRILSPEALKQDPVDAVIVMAASYSDEVARIIHKRFGRKIHIAILREAGLETAD